jgi:hypothetical protein
VASASPSSRAGSHDCCKGLTFGDVSMPPGIELKDRRTFNNDLAVRLRQKLQSAVERARRSRLGEEGVSQSSCEHVEVVAKTLEIRIRDLMTGFESGPALCDGQHRQQSTRSL